MSKDRRHQRASGRIVTIILLLLLFFLPVGYLLYWQPLFDWGQAAAPGKIAAPAEARIPLFDVVRAETTGEILMAGRAEAGWTVRVQSGETLIGEVKADDNGDWVLQPDKPLPPGDYSLRLSASAADGQRTLSSRQRITLAVSGKKAAPLAALSDEGKPSRVLQSPEPVNGKGHKRAAASAAPGQPAEPGVAAGKAEAPAKPAAQPAVELAFRAIDYEKKGSGRGKVFLHGQAAPGSRLMLYIDNEFAGTASAGADGAWKFSGERELTRGAHQMRSDQVEASTGKVLARAEVTYERLPPKETPKAAAPAGQEKQTAALEKRPPDTPAAEKKPDARPAAPDKPAGAPLAPPIAPMQDKRPAGISQPSNSGGGQTAAAKKPPESQAGKREERQSAAPSPPQPAKSEPEKKQEGSQAAKRREQKTAALPPAQAEKLAKAARKARRTGKGKKTRRGVRVIIVRRGDSLWHIARRLYGDGERYTKIFQSNKGQIRDPQKIYPGQRITAPQ